MTLNLSEQINSLHDKLCGLARTSLETAIEIGELLTRQKAELKHGEWLPWCRENLRFSQDSANRWMGIFRIRNEIPQCAEFGLSDAYALLAKPASDEEQSEESPEIDFEPDPSPKAIVPKLETSAQKEAAWDMAQEMAEDEGVEMNSLHVQQAAAAVAKVQPSEDDEKDIKSEAKQHVHVGQNSGENEWYTPSPFIESARKVMGSIDLDPASCEVANKRVKASKIYTKEESGLMGEWQGNVWMNPPYAQPLIQLFSDRIAEQFRVGNITQAIVLVNNATETKWFQSMARESSAVCFPQGRVRFLDPDGNPGAPLQGQAIIYFGGNGQAFADEFAQYGKCYHEG